jgi:hypothetical protein
MVTATPRVRRIVGPEALATPVLDPDVLVRRVLLAVHGTGHEQHAAVETSYDALR